MTAQRDAACIASRARAVGLTARRNAVFQAFAGVDRATADRIKAMAKANDKTVVELFKAPLRQAERNGIWAYGRAPVAVPYARGRGDGP